MDRLYQGLGAAVVDPGYPVAFEKTIAEDGGVREGGGADPVSSYTILEAATIDDAVGAVAAPPCPTRPGRRARSACQSARLSVKCTTQS